LTTGLTTGFAIAFDADFAAGFATAAGLLGLDLTFDPDAGGFFAGGFFALFFATGVTLSARV